MAKERALPDLKTRIVVDDSQLKKAGGSTAKSLKATEDAAKKTSKATHGLAVEAEGVASKMGLVPNAAKGAAGSLENLSKSGVLSGGSLLALGGIATAAAGLLVVGGEKSLQMYQQLGDEVENYKRVVGSSAEESGRMVQTFVSLGVGADTATGGMFKLSKAIESTPKKLADLGIVIARTRTGTVDLANTLYNVADAYNATADQGKKNQILLVAFGKSGKDMIPILEQGSASLKKLEDQAALTFTDADLARLKQTQIQQAQVKQGWDAIWESIGQKLLPAQEQLYESINRGTYIEKRMNEEVAKGNLTYEQAFEHLGGMDEKTQALNDKFAAEYDASLQVSVVLAKQTQATKDAAAANDALVKSADDLISEEDKLYKITETIAGQADKVTQATWARGDAQKKLTDDTKAFGPHSRQALQDAIDLRSANQALTDVIRQGGVDRRQRVIDIEAQTGATRDVNKENAAEIKYYQDELKHVGKGSPLYKKLQEWIALLQTVPGNVSTDIIGNFRTFGPASGGKAYTSHAVGGRIAAGEVSWVGERGKELFVPDRQGTIVPHGQAASAAASKAPVTYSLTLVGTPVVNDPDGVRRTLQRMAAIGAASG